MSSYVVAGKADDPSFARAEYVAKQDSCFLALYVLVSLHVNFLAWHVVANLSALSQCLFHKH